MFIIRHTAYNRGVEIHCLRGYSFTAYAATASLPTRLQLHCLRGYSFTAYAATASLPTRLQLHCLRGYSFTAYAATAASTHMRGRACYSVSVISVCQSVAAATPCGEAARNSA